MKVYVVLTECVYDGEYDHSVMAFDTEQKARNYFEEVVKETEENDHLFSGNLDVVVERGKNSFCAYEEGYYSCDHISFNIEEVEVE